MSSSPVFENELLPYIVALTGGIASGKTLVSDEFAKLGVPVIDTDVIAHECVEPGKPALQKIVDFFGPDIVDVNGRLKRSDLRELIFSNPTARKKLESILHPMIRNEVSIAIQNVTAAYCILVIPLLAEGKDYPYVDRILVIDIEPTEQVKRLMARDDCSREQATKALVAQASRQQRLRIADDVLKNSGTPERTRGEVQALHEKYLQLATRR